MEGTIIEGLSLELIEKQTKKQANAKAKYIKIITYPNLVFALPYV
jgi:type II secretory pathway component PulF